MKDIEELVVNVFLFFVLFCIAGAMYTRLAARSKLLQTTVGLPS